MRVGGTGLVVGGSSAEGLRSGVGAMIGQRESCTGRSFALSRRTAFNTRGLNQPPGISLTPGDPIANRSCPTSPPINTPTHPPTQPNPPHPHPPTLTRPGRGPLLRRLIRRLRLLLHPRQHHLYELLALWGPLHRGVVVGALVVVPLAGVPGGWRGGGSCGVRFAVDGWGVGTVWGVGRVVAGCWCGTCVSMHQRASAKWILKDCAPCTTLSLASFSHPADPTTHPPNPPTQPPSPTPTATPIQTPPTRIRPPHSLVTDHKVQHLRVRHLHPAAAPAAARGGEAQLRQLLAAEGGQVVHLVVCGWFRRRVGGGVGERVVWGV